MTMVGMALTGVIAFAGFRSFSRWRREKLEERRIEVAFEVLGIAYETKFIFEHIRSPLTSSYEWADMPKKKGETYEQRDRRGPFYAVFMRLQANKDFFESVWRIQPKCMAVFGPEIESTFLKLHQARRKIEVAAEMLVGAEDEQPAERRDLVELYTQLRRDIADHGEFQKDKDRVAKLVQEFVHEVVAKARPIVDQRYKGDRRA